jgi:hypothetical protein
MDEAEYDALAFTTFHRTQIYSTNPLEVAKR